ncbi:DeoR/GlpR family DNA-binding transcription regulator [Ruminiclostridium cellobioparum]|uniref:DeoR/GlpR family DNA-binding transcription regulator n=1 Tax=Ruminiclostridium cellobioparum TaxID=29355 RepID=UPI0004851EAD|nr:DeoR/GlpR family DNA-binding transcription regulator [Ruminiclostridium cellobioparum]
MFEEERHNKILNMINSKKSVKVHELSEALYVSTATVRRDLAKMEKAGVIKRSHGGAVLVDSSSAESAISVRELENIKEKKKIAGLAISFISSNSVIFMDSSSTAGMVIPYLSQFKYLTVITNGLKNALLLSEKTDAKIYMPGGIVSTRSNSLLGSDTLDYLSNLNAGLAIFSCSGLTPNNGVTDASFEQSKLKRALIRNSKVRVLLCDSSKFGGIYMCRTCGFEELDYILTDKKPQTGFMEAASKHGCEILWPQ